MKKVIRLTESDLVRIVKRVISEQIVEKVAGPYGTPPVQYYIFISEGKFFIYGTNATNKSPILLQGTLWNNNGSGYNTQDEAYKVIQSQLHSGKSKSSQRTSPLFDPIQEPFYDYVRKKWGHDEDPMFATSELQDKDGRFILFKGQFGRTLPFTDEDSIIWDYKKGLVTGTKSFGDDPKPIPIVSNFEQMKKWFDSTY